MSYFTRLLAKILSIASFISVSFCSQAQVSQWSLGVAASYSPAVYIDTPSNQTVIPLVGYEGEYYFLRGFSAGRRVFPLGSPHNIIFRVAYDPRTLKPKDSEDANIQKLDERKASILTGVSYQALTMLGILETTIGTDVASRHNGLYAEATWRVPIRRNSWGITPSLGYAYNSARLNDHLYGVSEIESKRTHGEIDTFEADWDGQFFVGLSGYMLVGKNFRVTGGIRYTNLEGDIEKSPIIESGINTMISVGMAYTF